LLILRPIGSQAHTAPNKGRPSDGVIYLLLTLRADEHDHPLALEVRYIIRFAVLGKVGSEACEKQFSLLLEHDRASAEEDVGFHFVAFLEELDRVLELEVIVVIVGLRAESDLLHFLFLGIGFGLFLLFLGCVKELLVVHYTAHGRSRSRSYLDQVEVEIIGNLHCLLEGVNTLLYIVADEAHFLDTADLVIDTMRILFDNSTAARSVRGCCYSFFLL